MILYTRRTKPEFGQRRAPEVNFPAVVKDDLDIKASLEQTSI